MKDNNLIQEITKNTRASLFVICILTCLVYANTFVNGFVLQDKSFIVDWPLIKDLNNLFQFFGPNNQPEAETGIYSPLKTLFCAFNYHFFKENPLGYHAIALLVHLVGVIFVFRICLLLSVNNLAAFLSGLIFALHPVNSEAITFLTASIDSSGVVFLFISFYFFIKDGGIKDRILSVVFAFLAVFTNELTITLALLFMLHEIYFRRERGIKKLFLRVAPFFLIAGIYILSKYLVLGSAARGGYLLGSFYLTIIVLIKAFAKYIILLLFPFNLAVNHSLSPGIYSADWKYFDRYAFLSQSILESQVIASILIIFVLFYYSARLARKNKIISFSIYFFFVSLLPALNIISSECYFAERYLYLANLGFSLAFGVVAASLLLNNQIVKERRRYIAYIVFILFCFYAFRSVLRNSDWQNELTLARAEQRAYPENPQANKNLGAVFLVTGMTGEARRYLEKSISLKPSAEAYYFLSQANYELKNPQSEMELLKKALSLDPLFSEAHYNLATALMNLGEKEEAREHLSRAISLFLSEGKYDAAQVAQQLFDKFLNIP
ncbi:MAG: tetratricopeptide repeat protein [Candidatus Omnitrophica bacterium]|nr:tetratricopeptide repeat protein [Candidatus Omnitrophota bacterium]